MSTLAVTSVSGSRGATTVAAGLAMVWPTPVLLVELDPSGGDVAAWWDLPESPGIAAAVTSGSDAAEVVGAAQVAAGGLSVMPAPLRSREAATVVGEAVRVVLPGLRGVELSVIFDAGRSTDRLAPAVAGADAVLVVGWQVPDSSRATAAIIERVADVCDLCAAQAIPASIAMVGTNPFGVGDVERFAGHTTFPVANDPLGAAVIAGRPATGRLAKRSALLRSLTPIAADLHGQLTTPVEVQR